MSKIAEINDVDRPNGRPNHVVSGQISEPLNIHFENVSCVVNKRTLTEFWKCERIHILKNVNGDFVGGKLTGIIGPSGGGKSTLLDIVSGFRSKDVSGYVYLNGRERKAEMIRRSCYIMQDSLLEPLVTVEETMTFVANVKLNSKISRKDKDSLVSKILRDFGLDEHRRTLTNRLSGGERKKLAIALDLISNPTILFLDEPTSGLDSKSAKQCVQMLRDLASEGRTVVCSIHQPSMSILDLFNNIYMLTGGECIYQGTVPGIIAYLKQNGLECPRYHNPIEFVMELCVLNPEKANVQQLVEAIENGKSQEWFDKAACWSIVPLNTSTLNLRSTQSQHLNAEVESRQYATSFSHQCRHLLRRKIQIELRDPLLLRIRLLTHLIAGFVFGIIFYGIGNDGSKTVVILNLLFFSVMLTVFTALTSRIITFPQSLRIVRREYFNRWYSIRAFYISSLFADIPIQIFSVMLFILPMYYLSDLPSDCHRVVRFVLIAQLLPLFFQDYGILVGTLLDVTNGLMFGMFSTTPFVMFSGLLLYPRDTPRMFRWLYESSVLRHAIEGVVTSVFGYDRKPLECYQLFCFLRYPKDFLKWVDLDTDRYEYNLFFILMFGLFIKFLCYVALKFRLSRGP